MNDLSLKTLAGLAVWTTAMAGVGIAGICIALKMADEVNAANATSFSYVGWGVPKTLRLFQEHKRLFPESKSRRNLIVVYSGGVALVIGMVIRLGVFR